MRNETALTIIDDYAALTLFVQERITASFPETPPPGLRSFEREYSPDDESSYIAGRRWTELLSDASAVLLGSDLRLIGTPDAFYYLPALLLKSLQVGSGESDLRHDLQSWLQANESVLRGALDEAQRHALSMYLIVTMPVRGWDTDERFWNESTELLRLAERLVLGPEVDP